MDFPPFVNPSGWEGIVQTTEIIICVPPPYGRGNTKNSSERTLPLGFIQPMELLQRETLQKAGQTGFFHPEDTRMDELSFEKHGDCGCTNGSFAVK